MFGIFFREPWTLDDVHCGVVCKFNDAVTFTLLPRDTDVESDVRYKVVSDKADVQIPVRYQNSSFFCATEPKKEIQYKKDMRFLL